MVTKSSKMLSFGGIKAVACGTKHKNKHTYNYDYERNPDKRLIDFCLDCPHENCTGNRCKEFIAYEKSLITEN